jgi:AraC-like DNA-binding protein
MKIETHIPTELLKPFIRKYLVIESQDGMLNRILPDTSPVMAFRFKGKVSYQASDIKETLPASSISGLRRSGRLISYSTDAGNILVIFREAGAGALIREPLYELFEESVSLDNLTGYRNLSMLQEQLAGATDNMQRVHMVEQFLLSKLYHQKTDTLILAALEKIHAAKGMIRIKDLAATLCISQDAFEKRFRKVAGVSPKQFSYIIRMKSIVSNGLKEHTLAETAFNAGYFDQPHFNKDFKLFTGQTPTDFLRSPLLW